MGVCPNGVGIVLGTLSLLQAKEAANTLIEYFFWDPRSGGDYRIKSGDSFDRKTYECDKGFAYGMARLGRENIGVVLRRYANTTPEERSMQVGGGGAPALVLHYLKELEMSPTDAENDIEVFIKHTSGLTEGQARVLRELQTIVKDKRYRPARFTGEWAPVSGTNAVSDANTH